MALAPPPVTPTPAAGLRLIGIGVGPGDPELMTLKALNELRRADLVLVPATEESEGGPGRAETIVLDTCPEARVQRVPFSMADRSGVSDRRRRAWWDSAEAAVAAFASGARTVALATIGDPSVYSTFSYLAAHVRERLPSVRVDLVPGITAMQALAARSGTPLVEGTETLALVPATAGLDTLATITDLIDTVVVYKSGRRLPEVVALLRSRGRDAVLGVQLGLEDEHILQLGDVVDGQQAPYLSTVLAPASRTSTGGRL